MLPVPVRILLGSAIVAGTVVLVAACFRLGVVHNGTFGWCWIVIVVAIGVFNLYSCVLRGRPPLPGHGTRAPRG